MQEPINDATGTPITAILSAYCTPEGEVPVLALTLEDGCTETIRLTVEDAEALGRRIKAFLAANSTAA